jgi:hypothetical protein
MTSIALMATGGCTAGGLAGLVLIRFGSSKRTSIRSSKSETKDSSSQAIGNSDKGDDHD